MSNTRIATAGTLPRQERFASSPEFRRGLMANLVAQRCSLIKNRKDRELLWFIQKLSHQEGGLEQVASALINQYPERVSTPSMRKFGMAPDRVCTADQVKAIRAEIPAGNEIFLLTGEMTDVEFLAMPEGPDESRWFEASFEQDRQTARQRQSEMAERARRHPKAYLAEVFATACLKAAEALPEYLAEICLNPAIQLDKSAPWYFPTLIETLREFMGSWIEERKRGVVITEIGAKVCETLEYAVEGKCLVLIDGRSRTGKSHAAEAWCKVNPGRARLVQVPASNDDIGFFHEIAKTLGVSINLNSKAQELRQRIEAALRGGDLMLVFDEAHYLWPTGNYRLALPGRLNWIMTALVNFGVPVALITTPLFFKGQKAIEDRTHWTSEQFIGRIGHYQKLPDTLQDRDLVAVAKSILPEGDKDSIEILVCYAKGSAKYLAAIETATRRARYLAARAGRQQVLRNDVKRAITESVIPSDSALARALTVSPFTVTRAVQVTCQKGSLFTAAMVAKQTINLNGNNISTDSFNSSDPTKSRNGQYDAATYAGDMGDVASNDTIADSLSVGNANIHGHTHTGIGSASGSVAIGPNGVIGTHAYAASNSGIQPGYWAADANFTFPDTSMPNLAGYLSPTGGIYVVASNSVGSSPASTTSGIYPSPTPVSRITTNTTTITVATFLQVPGSVPANLITTNISTSTVASLASVLGFPPPLTLTTNTTSTTSINYPADGTFLGLVTTNTHGHSITGYTYQLITGYTYTTAASYAYPTYAYTYYPNQTNVVYLTNTYDHILWGGSTAPSYYVPNSSLTRTLVQGPNVVLAVPNGLSMSGNDAFTILPGANLTVYTGGTSIGLNGNSVLNQPGTASSFILYCAPSVTSFSLSGNAGFTGVLVAPNANVSMNGGGNNTIDFIGCIMVNSITMNGHFNFHYDEALQNVASNGRFLIMSWNEVK